MAEWIGDALPYAAVPLLAKPSASYPSGDGHMVSLSPDRFAEEAEKLLDSRRLPAGGLLRSGARSI